MKKKMNLLLISLLSFCMTMAVGLSLSACSNDDDETEKGLSESLGELFEEDNKVEPSFENPYVVKEEGFRLQFQLWPPDDNGLRTGFQQGERIVACLLISPGTGFEIANNSGDDNGGLKIDKYFLAIYTTNGNLVKTIDPKQIERNLILADPCDWEITYVWDPLPPGNYYTKLTVKYNTKPWAEERAWAPHTFRTDFTVK